MSDKELESAKAKLKEANAKVEVDQTASRFVLVYPYGDSHRRKVIDAARLDAAIIEGAALLDSVTRKATAPAEKETEADEGGEEKEATAGKPTKGKK